MSDTRRKMEGTDTERDVALESHGGGDEGTYVPLSKLARTRINDPRYMPGSYSAKMALVEALGALLKETR